MDAESLVRSCWMQLVVAGCGMLVAAGCAREDAAADGRVAQVARRVEPRDESVPAPLPIAQKPSPASISGGGLSDLAVWLRDQNHSRLVGRLPNVSLSEQHRATCLVHVGDSFPVLALETLDGHPTTLSAHFGPRGTVVIFWQTRQPMAVEQIRRLRHELVERYRAVGLQIVTVAVDSDVQRVKPLLAAAGLENQSVNLVDSSGHALAQVARDHLPRTYFLEPSGTVLWFDLEYSRATRTALEQAVLFYLQQLPN